MKDTVQQSFTRKIAFLLLIERMIEWEGETKEEGCFMFVNNHLAWIGCSNAEMKEDLRKLGESHPEIGQCVHGRIVSAGLFSWICQLYAAEYIPRLHGSTALRLGNELAKMFAIEANTENPWQDSLEVVAIDVQRKKIVFQTEEGRHEEITKKHAKEMRLAFGYLGYKVSFIK